jgi:6-phospho-beta-glucosidase
MLKVAIIGGAGLRIPLLVRGLCGSDLPIGQITLFDTDRERLRMITALAQTVAGQVSVVATADSADCVRDADFVFLSIRVGGITTRANDEAVCLRHGIVGQETVGPAGFALAMRTIPHVRRYAEQIAELAPRAWLINFSNPVGIITQALCGKNQRAVGICDTPTELFEEVASVLGERTEQCHFDYLGLNHLGWLREVYVAGVPQLHRLWSQPQLLEKIWRAPLFDPAFVRELRLLPTEYLYYYYRSHDAVAHLRRAETTRGSALVQLNADLLRELASSPPDPVAVYDQYIAKRDGSYMQIEAHSETRRPTPGALTGYDRIALGVARAIHFGTGAILPLDVPSRGNLPELEPDDVVEIPCAVGHSGPLPLHVGAMPEQVRPLVTLIKKYERATLAAALSGNRDGAIEALSLHPFVGNSDLASRLVGELELSS